MTNKRLGQPLGQVMPPVKRCGARRSEVTRWARRYVSVHTYVPAPGEETTTCVVTILKEKEKNTLPDLDVAAPQTGTGQGTDHLKSGPSVPVLRVPA